MNRRAKTLKWKLLLAVLMAAGGAHSSPGQSQPAAGPSATASQSPTNAAPAQPAIPQSVFIVPTSDKDGRDPFFPDASLQLGPAETPAASEAPKVIELTLQGFSGEGEHRLAIINEESFAAGDQGFVSTSAGRVSIHCIELLTNAVIVEVNGERRELWFQPNQ